MKSLCAHNWEDLSEKNKILAFSLLQKLMKGQITATDFKIQMLISIYGKIPTKTSVIKKLIAFIFLPQKKFQKWIDNRNFEDQLDEFIFLRSAEMLDFAFKIENNEIVPNYYFKQNQFPDLSSHTPTFTRNFTIDTNITAKQYSHGVDLLSEISNAQSVDEMNHYLQKLFEVLYQIEDATMINNAVLFGVSFWFRGVVLFFQNHPVYNILFRNSETTNEDDDKISLGMNETILQLNKDGYSDVNNMNIVDFFDAQIKALKDYISSALGMEMKPEEIMKKTGLDISIIMKLS